MVELLKYTREQLVEEVQKKEASRLKLKEKLVQLKELSVNTAQVLQLNRNLEEQLASANKKQQASTKECHSLRTDLQAAHDLTQEANTLLTEQQRNQQNLQQQVAAAKAQAATAERSCSQAQAAKGKSDMAFHALESELAALRKQLSHFQAGLKSIEQRQKAEHQEVVQLKSQVSASVPAPNVALTCQGCSAVQEAVLSLQKQVQERDLASAKGSTKASSAPSTQDHSGDTLDDRNHVQLRSEMQGLQDQLVTCQNQQQQFEAEMHRWRTLFGSFAALAAPGATALQASSDMMQISPAGAEGSNVVPRHTPELHQIRGDKSRVPHRMQTDTLPAAVPAAHAGRTTEHGMIAVARVNSTGADSDTFSAAAAGTTTSLMVPANQRKPQTRPQLTTAPAQDPPAIALSPKRKTIALQPGALQIPDGGRKRRKLAKAVQADQAQTAQEPIHVTQQQPQPQQSMPSRHPANLAHLAKYGAPLTDATAVDFMELQLARICNTQEPITAALVSAVALCICCAWQAKRCPLDCILAGFIAALLDCTAAPLSPTTEPAKLASKPSQHSQPQSNTLDNGDSTGTYQALEGGALAKLWCSEVACQQYHFTWLMHCAVELDTLLSSPPSLSHTQAVDPVVQSDQAQGRLPAQSPADPLLPSQGSGGTAKATSTAGKKRGRPPGSRNKKTLLKLQEEGKSLQDLPPAKAKRPPAASLQQHAQQPQHEEQSQQQAGQQATHEQDQQQARKRQRQALSAPLAAGALLEGLHKQTLHYLGQACQVKPSGPFETEVCSLSAAAALLARLQGKEQALRVQVLTTLGNVDLAPCIQLHSVAAALEVWPEALVPPQPSTPSDHSTSDHGDAILQHQGLVGMCVHAKLQVLCQRLGQPSSTSTSADLSQPGTAPGLVLAQDDSPSMTGRKLLLAWGQSILTHTAAQAVRDVLSIHWQQQHVESAQQADPGRLSREATAPLCAAAAEKVLAELRHLGTTEEGDVALLDDRWANLGLALQLIISCLGWEWAYEQVLNKLMGPIVSALLLPATRDSGQWAIHSLEQLLQCMVLTVQALLKAGCRKGKACTVALEALVHRLTGMAQKCMSHTAVYTLLTNAVQSMKLHLGRGGLTAHNDQIAGIDAGVDLETF